MAIWTVVKVCRRIKVAVKLGFGIFFEMGRRLDQEMNDGRKWCTLVGSPN